MRRKRPSERLMKVASPGAREARTSLEKSPSWCLPRKRLRIGDKDLFHKRVIWQQIEWAHPSNIP